MIESGQDLIMLLTGRLLSVVCGQCAINLEKAGLIFSLHVSHL